MIYYPVSSHEQKMLADFGGANFKLPKTDALNKCVLSLPIHSELSEEELTYITETVLNGIKAQQ
jgi:dTDP-4-amino-4,6-dideoxygalactose transaminase